MMIGQYIRLSTKRNFRYDVNLLRVFAILGVLLFHFKFSFVTSGFAGVDVFFVVSGFLMTKIIVTSIDNRLFSFWGFYVSRGIRILPALIFLCIILLVLGWFICLPSEYRLLSKHVASSILFVSNIIFSNESGYFDSSADYKLLLHTWSLSVEWQFYLFYPIVLVVLCKCFNKQQVFGLLLLFVLASVLYISLRKVMFVDYFSFPLRAWEMLAGGLTFFMPDKVPLILRKMMYWIGILVILISFFAFNKAMSWPSVFTCFPVLGSVLVLGANHKHSWLQNNIISYYIGRTSYSIYLWHWPVYVFSLSFFQKLSSVESVAAIVMSCLLGFISYELIETRFTNSMRKWNLLGVTFICWLVTFSFSIFIFLNNGLPIESRFPSAVLAADMARYDQDPRKISCSPENSLHSPHCGYPADNESFGQILFGDSHAGALVSAFSHRMESHGATMLIAQPGCPSIKGVIKKGRTDSICSDFVTNELNYIQESYPGLPIYVYDRWSYYIDGKVGGDGIPIISFMSQGDLSFEENFYDALEATWCPVARERPVTMLLPTPEFPYNVPLEQAKNILSGSDSDVYISHEQYLLRNKIIINSLRRLSNSCGVRLVDLGGEACSAGKCLGSSAGRPMYYDDTHLSLLGAELILRDIKL